MQVKVPDRRIQNTFTVMQVKVPDRRIHLFNIVAPVSISLVVTPMHGCAIGCSDLPDAEVCCSINQMQRYVAQ